MNYRVLNIFVIFCFILVGTFASGWHFANDILPGTFSDGDFIFNGSVKIVSGNDICIDGGICLGAVDSLYLNKTAKAADSNLLDGVDSNRILTQKTDIPSGANLNNYVTTGLYHQNGNSYAAAGSNYPVSLAGMLEVIEDGSMIYQKYQVYNSAGDLYFRTRYAGTWYAWKKTATTAYVDSKIKTPALSCKTKSLTGGNYNKQTVSCDTGYTITGGGCIWRSDGNNAFVYSQPNGNGWYCRDDDYAYVAGIYAICCKVV